MMTIFPFSLYPIIDYPTLSIESPPFFSSSYDEIGSRVKTGIWSTVKPRLSVFQGTADNFAFKQGRL